MKHSITVDLDEHRIRDFATYGGNSPIAVQCRKWVKDWDAVNGFGRTGGHPQEGFAPCVEIQSDATGRWSLDWKPGDTSTVISREIADRLIGYRNDAVGGPMFCDDGLPPEPGGVALLSDQGVVFTRYDGMWRNTIGLSTYTWRELLRLGDFYEMSITGATYKRNPA